MNPRKDNTADSGGAGGKEKLPAFKTAEECIAYCESTQDTFYLTAFMLEAWIGTSISKAVEQYTERKTHDRRLQTGAGWEAWQFVFGHATPEEWPHIMDAFGRYVNCDTPDAEIAGMVLSLTIEEDRLAEPVLFQTRKRQFGDRLPPKEELLKLVRYPFERMSEWLEAVVHWRVHRMVQRAPITNQPTEELRELAHIGIMQASYANLGEHSKAWWRFRHEELAKQFCGKPEWSLVGKAQSFTRWGELRQPEVDELAIHWWPLLRRYQWTDRDMRNLLMQVVRHPNAYPLREDKEFADYRQKALGLVKGGGLRAKSNPEGKPTGWKAALAMIGRLSE
jgi:hypothetical protein